MKTVKCINETCLQHDIDEYIMGLPEYVVCGACGEPCKLSDEYADPELPIFGEP